ncbi:HAD family hydrolase [Candidatus Woesearchaeota archaeon]|nr:HAD family hydrolase [Candidatus Woesearchaeota archaeon]
MVKGIIFDFWGTLVENGIHPSPVNQVKYILRLRMPFKEFVVRFEEAMMTREYADLNEAFTAVCEEFRIPPNKYILERLVGMWNKNEFLGKPFFEVIDILEYLKSQGLKIALISNTNPTIMRVIEKYKLDQYFDAQILSYKEGKLKTDPELFQKALGEIGLKAKDVIMIGDSIQTDIIGAKNAGLRAILIDRMNKRDYQPKIRNLRELKELVENGKLDEHANQEPTLREDLARE